MPGRFNDRENGETAYFPRRHPEQRETRSNFRQDWESGENKSEYRYGNPEEERYSTRGRYDRRGQFDRDYGYDQQHEQHDFNSSAYQRWKSEWDREPDYNAGQRHSQYEQGPYFGRGPKGYRRSDERIEEDINERLTQHPFIDATELEVRVQSGEVVLSGTVDDRNAKRIAEDIADSVSGVKDVQNQIRINKNFNKNG
jgi:osmotically-inducible protein OsmY